MLTFLKNLTTKICGFNTIQSNAFHSSPYWGESNELNGTEDPNVTLKPIDTVVPILEFNDITDPLVIAAIKKALQKVAEYMLLKIRIQAKSFILDRQ